MRKLATACLSFSAAVFAANYILPLGSLPWLGALFALSGFGLLLMRKKRLRGMVISLLALSFGLASFGAHYLRFSLPAKELEGRTMELSACLLEYPIVYDDYCSGRVLLQTEGLPRMEAIIYDGSMELQQALPGQSLSFSGKLSPADVRFGQDYDYYNSRDIYLRISLRSTPEIGGGGPGIRSLPLELNRRLSLLADELFPADTAPFMKSLLLGDRTEFYKDQALRLSMSRSGFMHVVAVSGMHIAFLVGFVQLLLGKTRRGSLLCLCLVWLFVFMTGASHSAVRAGIMQSFLLMAPVLRRENDALTSLSAALGLILFLNPYAAASVSLQLSFGAMAGIMCFAERLNGLFTAKLSGGALGGLLRYILGIAASSIAVMAFTMPLMGIHFGYISLLSVITNVLGLWAVSLCFCGGLLACALGALSPALGSLLAWPAAICARYIFALSGLVSGLPFSGLYVENWKDAVWIGLCYAFFALWAFSRVKLRYKLIAPAALSLLCLALLFGADRRLPGESEGLISVLDVGQGQCISLISRDDAVMIDCGGTGTLKNAGETAGAYLKKRGIDRLGLLLLTHLHADHANGVTALMELVEVERMIIPESPNDDDGLLEEILTSARSHGTQVEYLRDDRREELGHLSLELFEPGEKGDENERCIMALASFGDYNMLVTGDAPKSAERELMERQGIEDAELYIVGHHGSRYSSSGELLGGIGAETAVISVGYNSYGHPTHETLERLQAYGYNIYRTDLNGTVEIWIGNDDGKEKQP